MALIPTLIIIIVFFLTVAFFYLKCSPVKSIATLWSAVIAMILSFSYYEFLAGLLPFEGGGLDWLAFISFSLLFAVSLATLYLVLDYLIPLEVDLGAMTKLVTAVVCGLLTSVILSGVILVAMGMIPMHGKIFYSRYDPDTAVLSTKRPRKPALNVDGFVTGLYGWISSGSLSSGQSFALMHADFLTQNHLNKLKVPEVMSSSAADAISLPGGKTVKPIRYDAEKQYLIVRAGINKRDIASKSMQFFLGQIRLIAKESPSSKKPFTGSGTAFYPVGFWRGGKVVSAELSESIPDKLMKQQGNKIWLDIAFNSPGKLKPVLLQFKQHAIADLSGVEAVENTLEVERALDEVTTDAKESGSNSTE